MGVFDSGVGGLSIAKCIHQTLPYENLIYVADTQYAPYGDIQHDILTKRVHSIAQYFLSKKVKAIVVACNTATVSVISQLREEIEVPIIGVEPAIKPAALASKNAKVGILVTQATAKNKNFIQLVERYKNDAQVSIQACPGLVDLIEQGKIDNKECQQLLQQYLTPLLNEGIDSLVLGCTHYPFLIKQIKAIAGDQLTIYETATPVTQQLKRRLAALSVNASLEQTGQCQFLSSKVSSQQQELFSKLWGQSVDLKPLP
ncbi:glutamate racemase [Colwellia sp. 12G3]|nr:glutamate racemase [Colwellia sp. 12G3]